MDKVLFLGMLLVALATIIGAFGALLFKLASAKVEKNIFSLLKSKSFFLGIFLYGLSALIFVWALKSGELSLLYPLAGLSYIWITLLSKLILKERINSYKWLGIGLIILGEL